MTPQANQTVLGVANCIFSLAEVAMRNGSAEYARKLFGQAASMYLHAGDLLGGANCIMRLADIARSSSDFECARSAYRQALEMFQKIGDAVGEGVCARGLTNCP